MEGTPTNEERKKPMTERERKAAQREREKAMATGTYVKSPLEQAKEFLAAQPTLEITTIESN
jgi:hypothetical protein